MSDCLFCKIIDRQIPAQIVYEDEQMLAFKDIAPKAPVHVLLIPKRHITSLEQAQPQDAQLLQSMLMTLPKLAKKLGLNDGFRTVLNTGAGGGQEVYHLHFHLLGDVRQAKGLGF